MEESNIDLTENESFTIKDVKELSKDLDVVAGLATDLLTLGGGDGNMVRRCSAQAHRLDTLKCMIIDERLKKIEQHVYDIIERQGIQQCL